jgi:hypothetical protein
MGKIVWHDNGSYKIEGSFNRKQLAVEYELSEKQFRKELNRHNIFLGNQRILSAMTVDEIIKKLGRPVIYGNIEP